jgi:hypothetical protein
MSPMEAKKIIEALAAGIDPETGESLPSESILNSPRVIRALYAADAALTKAVKRGDRESSIPVNAGRAWSEEEDEALLANFDSGIPVEEIAQRHARTRGAITSRLVRHGRIKDPTEA